ncbi:MAG: ribbon-helix-helix protein, CopG family [candidate division NC10 bacterium]|nr:ribbon-helix-helix protein, CopG family [candidate division NC10 bacterium]MBI2562140.1 ribbon-helix-helix protein, CopG family [candidate division NC10 bacterium]
MARRTHRLRVTASLDAGVVKALDDLAKRRGLSSRSRALEAALSYWITEQERRRVEEEVEAYYRGRTGREKREDKEWAEFTSRSSRHLEADE